ncbi:sporulation integral membrane protein YlbJ [Paenibacillus tarimensis]|uniref:sporulation integral membrane protein YlbJ n=1 Tax=Paenibacillus tarimensis TaxID=416012 RepID=UPI001F2A4905|nr:sporulation integral membrane protein YlbJ [Paenibacillus tarimensis]MCF2943527.1 sporulation integral membrane protein YlbJ [Paenibacillus tarimensis]
MLRSLLRPLPLLAWTCMMLLVLLACFPEEALRASSRGLSIWWDVLFPSLFPFFIISELMLGFGVVHFFGTLLDPLMRPLFRLPGIAGFVVTMGYVSGYPVGARLTAQLREKNQVTRAEGERMVAFTTTSDPIFLIGAVSVGFFHNAQLALVLAASHYGAAFLIGLLARFHDRKGASTPPRKQDADNPPLLRAAFEAMHEARISDGRVLGKLLEDAITSALRLMIVVGGLVVFFSAVMEMLNATGTLALLSSGVQSLLYAAGLPHQLSAPLVNGLFEVTLGAKAAAESGAPLIHQAAAAAWVLSWAGLSVHAQVASLVSGTDIRYKPLLLARLLHSVMACALVYLLWGWFGP